MRRMPIPRRNRFLWPPGHAAPRRYAVLVGISPGYPPAGGRSHTCYSPVRRSPAGEASFAPAAPRLACVKPVASVHPEPGSNSSLLYLVISFSKSNKTIIYYCLSQTRPKRPDSLTRLSLIYRAALAELTGSSRLPAQSSPALEAGEERQRVLLYYS